MEIAEQRTWSQGIDFRTENMNWPLVQDPHTTCGPGVVSLCMGSRDLDC